MKKRNTIAVAGGSGKAGRELIEQLISQDFHLKVLTRNPALFELKHPNVQMVRGDVLNQNDVRKLVQNCQAVISVIGQRKGEPASATTSCRHFLSAMEEEGIRRYISLTGLTLDAPGDRKSLRTRWSGKLMKWLFPAVIADKQQAFELLQQSNADWTVVRIPYLAVTSKRSRTSASLEDCPGRKVSSSNLAAFLIAQLSDDRYLRKAPFIADLG